MQQRRLAVLLIGAQRIALEGVAEGVAEVQRLAYALLLRVLLHNLLLHADALGQQRLQVLEVGLGKVEVEQVGPMLIVRDEAVLQHLGVARPDVVRIERAQEFGV